MEKVTEHDYKNAIYVQSACNLSGVVFEFARVMKRICEEDNAEYKGTEWKNKHPICRLYAEQIAHLTRGDYFKAHEICEERSKQDEPNSDQGSSLQSEGG